jgi:uncharacterized membrane protein YbhN (UPF0104 family)
LTSSKRWLAWARVVITLAILGFVGWQFYRDLTSEDARELWTRSFAGGWLAAAGALYLGALVCSFAYWYLLLHQLDQRPSLVPAVRAYYISQLGKYLPGKAWALFIRAALVRSAVVRASVAVSTSFYEVLTTMAGGALLVAAVFWSFRTSVGQPGAQWRLATLQEPAGTGYNGGFLYLATGLAAGIGVVVLPGVFNRIARRIASPFRGEALPLIRWRHLVQGLFLTSGYWVLLGLSLFAVLRRMGEGWPRSWDEWVKDTGALALAYVAGFAIVFIPSGLGARELLLRLFLIQALARFSSDASAVRATASLAVLVLRLVWTSAEIAIIGFLYWLPGRGILADQPPTNRFFEN